MSAPIDIADVQSTAAAVIKAHAYFADITVIADDGAKQEAEEEALNNAGACVTVLPILDGDKAGDGHSSALVVVGLGVRYAVNPQKEGIPNPLEMLKKGTAALFGYSADEKRNSFRLAQKAFLIEVDDQGLRAYTAFYEKLAALRLTD